MNSESEAFSHSTNSAPAHGFRLLPRGRILPQCDPQVGEALVGLDGLVVLQAGHEPGVDAAVVAQPLGRPVLHQEVGHDGVRHHPVADQLVMLGGAVADPVIPPGELLVGKLREIRGVELPAKLQKAFRPFPVDLVGLPDHAVPVTEHQADLRLHRAGVVVGVLRYPLLLLPREVFQQLPGAYELGVMGENPLQDGG